MAKRVTFTAQARADIRAIPQPVAIQILRTLARFLEYEEGNVKRLQGIEPPLYRLRTQGHRVIFRDLGGNHIEVTRVRDRKGATADRLRNKKTEHCGPKRGNGASGLSGGYQERIQPPSPRERQA